MIGSALGDAIGELAFAFPEKSSLINKLDLNKMLRYTDDTAMAIGLAESIIEMGGIKEQHVGDTFKKNFIQEPWRGYASGPPTVFSLVEEGGITYYEAARSLFGGQGSLGNGAAMRIAPVGLFYHESSELNLHSNISAQVTHAHPVGMDGAFMQSLAVAQATKLDPEADFKAELFIENLVKNAKTQQIQKKMKLIGELIDQKISEYAAARQLGQTVAVDESMPFAVYAFLRYPQSFEDCLFCAVLNRGDRDTIGAMACAISGAYLGIEAIPDSWIKKLENSSKIKELATKLLEAH
jgi:poly(ADP-ribose) glycohydrolase ARH3